MCDKVSSLRLLVGVDPGMVGASLRDKAVHRGDTPLISNGEAPGAAAQGDTSLTGSLLEVSYCHALLKVLVGRTMPRIQSHD